MKGKNIHPLLQTSLETITVPVIERSRRYYLWLLEKVVQRSQATNARALLLSTFMLSIIEKMI
jgi:hypothetical protein